MIVTFDIADGSFDYYTNEEWQNQLAIWREELRTDGFEYGMDLDADEVVDMMYGEELFFSYFTPSVQVLEKKITLDRLPK